MGDEKRVMSYDKYTKQLYAKLKEAV